MEGNSGHPMPPMGQRKLDDDDEFETSGPSPIGSLTSTLTSDTYLGFL